jgi:hypothetical protein
VRYIKGGETPRSCLGRWVNEDTGGLASLCLQEADWRVSKRNEDIPEK